MTKDGQLEVKDIVKVRVRDYILRGAITEIKGNMATIHIPVYYGDYTWKVKENLNNLEIAEKEVKK